VVAEVGKHRSEQLNLGSDQPHHVNDQPATDAAVCYRIVLALHLQLRSSAFGTSRSFKVVDVGNVR